MNTKFLTSILQCSNKLIVLEDFLKRHPIGNAFFHVLGSIIKIFLASVKGVFLIRELEKGLRRKKEK